MHKKPEIIVFAGPNGSGKSTITRMANKWRNCVRIQKPRPTLSG